MRKEGRKEGSAEAETEAGEEAEAEEERTLQLEFSAFLREEDDVNVWCARV